MTRRARVLRDEQTAFVAVQTSPLVAELDPRQERDEATKPKDANRNAESSPL